MGLPVGVVAQPDAQPAEVRTPGALRHHEPGSHGRGRTAGMLEQPRAHFDHLLARPQRFGARRTEELGWPDQQHPGVACGHESNDVHRFLSGAWKVGQSADVGVLAAPPRRLRGGGVVGRPEQRCHPGPGGFRDDMCPQRVRSADQPSDGGVGISGHRPLRRDGCRSGEDHGDPEGRAGQQRVQLVGNLRGDVVEEQEDNWRDSV